MRDLKRELPFFKRLLIAEDLIPAGNALKEMLELRGYKVSLVTSGKCAVKKVYRIGEEIGVILMDINMPGEIDGIDAARQIQQKYPQIPVILVTAFAENEVYKQRIKEEKLGIVGVVDKPIIGANEIKLINLIWQELKKQLLKKIEDQLSIDSLPHIIQSLMDELSSGIGTPLLLEVIKDMENTKPANPFNTDEVWPYLNFMAYQNMKDELEKEYPDQFVAFLDGEMVGHDPNRDCLIKTVYKKHRRTDIFITEIAEDEVIKIRRPMKIIS